MIVFTPPLWQSLRVQQYGSLGAVDIPSILNEGNNSHSCIFVCCSRVHNSRPGLDIFANSFHIPVLIPCLHATAHGHGRRYRLRDLTKDKETGVLGNLTNHLKYGPPTRNCFNATILLHYRATKFYIKPTQACNYLGAATHCFSFLWCWAGCRSSPLSARIGSPHAYIGCTTKGEQKTSRIRRENTVLFKAFVTQNVFTLVEHCFLTWDSKNR